MYVKISQIRVFEKLELKSEGIAFRGFVIIISIGRAFTI